MCCEEAVLLQISEVFPLEDCCLNFSHEKTYAQQTFITGLQELHNKKLHRKN